MNKKQIIVLIILLILFLFPKPCEHWTTDPHSKNLNKDCTCIGLKYGPKYEGGETQFCFGVPISYRCSYNKVIDGNLEKVKTSCE